MTIKILNLYAGIGGNRKLWGNEHEITAIENNQGIAKIYQDFFPNDKVIVCDAHEYLLKHFNKFDFIWSNFIIGNTKKVERGIRTKSIEDKEKERGFKLPEDLTNNLKEKILNNCVFPELGLHILNMAFKEPQTTLK